MQSMSKLASYFSQKLGRSRYSSQAMEEEVVEAKDVDMDAEDSFSSLVDDKDCSPFKSKGKEISASNSETKLLGKNYASGSSHDFGTSSGLVHGEEEYDDRYILLQSYFDDLNIPTGVDFQVPIPLLKNCAVGCETTNSNSQFLPGEASGAAEFHDQHAVLPSYLDDLDIPTGVDFEIPFLNSSSTSLESENSKPKSASDSILDYDDLYAILQSYFDDLNIPTGVEVQIPCLNSTMPSALTNKSSGLVESSPKTWGFHNSVGISLQEEVLELHGIVKHVGADKGLHGKTQLAKSRSGTGSSNGEDHIYDKILKKLDLFKRFDIVQNYSDHYYTKNGCSMKQPSKGWAKKIQEEWRILAQYLLRVYESRMDLLRAAIVGAEGTPYHDGLFFFDMFFPDNYPSVPPMVHYHSHGLLINPNLYCCGKVCLSLLNTWTGGKKEMWNPRSSTILQVLVSIQGLILNAEPYFNEPGYEAYRGKPSGETNSRRYNEKTFISSLKTMVYTIRKPPSYFEDFVVGHYHKHAHYILAACKAYCEGAQVGSLIKGTVPNVRRDDKGCSKIFKDSLIGYLKTVADAFAQIGYKDC